MKSLHLLEIQEVYAQYSGFLGFNPKSFHIFCFSVSPSSHIISLCEAFSLQLKIIQNNSTFSGQREILQTDNPG